MRSRTHRHTVRKTELREGFTLVELLVVVAIVALLAALIMPGLGRAREYAYFTRCKSNLRQVGIGLMVFATDHRGSMHLIPAVCDAGTFPIGGSSGRKMGYFMDMWVRGYESGASDGLHFIDKLYMDGSNDRDDRPDLFVGRDWYEEMDRNGMVGLPRRSGKYLNIEVMWDPIAKVRDWGLWGHPGFPTVGTWRKDGVWTPQVHLYAGTEKHRDSLSRGAGNGHGIIGYTLFLSTVNCDIYVKDKSKKDHLLRGFGGDNPPMYAEGPNHRPDTANRPMRTGAHPSAWLGSCHMPRWELNGAGWRQFQSHFSARHAIPETFRFNVLHMGGHVDDSFWKEAYVSSRWSVYSSTVPWDQRNRPYGWWTRNPADNGYQEYPMFEGAFDQNADEFRKVRR